MRRTRFNVVDFARYSEMATLREFQMALQEKLEEIRKRDEIICELEDELAEKESAIERLRAELSKLRTLMSGGSHSGTHTPLLSVPSTGSLRSLSRQGSNSSANFRPNDATTAATLFAPSSAGAAAGSPRFRLPQPVSSSLRARMGLVKTMSAEPSTLVSSTSSGESTESGQNNQ